MPLTCDCYAGCWGDHSKGWPLLPGIKWQQVGDVVPYGSYVTTDAGLLVEPEYYGAAKVALGGIV